MENRTEKFNAPNVRCMQAVAVCRSSVLSTRPPQNLSHQHIKMRCHDSQQELEQGTPRKFGFHWTSIT
eukprot:1203000-Amphidinium_carterae.1